MQCILNGHQYVNEVQTITQVFFPGEKFEMLHALPCESTNIIIESTLTTTTASGTVYMNGAVISSHSEPTVNLPFYLTDRRVVMLALFHALKRVLDIETPWGTLTGIRPSKLVRDWLNKGMSTDAVIKTLQHPFCVDAHKAQLALDVALAEEKITKDIWHQKHHQAYNLNDAVSSEPVGLYISIPFCPSRCAYCSFNTSYKLPDEKFMSEYIHVLIDELEEKSKQIIQKNQHITSVYIGGGTPTALPDKLFEKLLFHVQKQIDNKTNIEFTVEAGRPDTITASNAALMKQYQVNRVAVNPQTLNDKTLQKIGRAHTTDDFYRAFYIVRHAGIKTVNVDLIAGLPGQTITDMQFNMNEMMKLSPENLTIHTLAVKRASTINENRDDYLLPTIAETEAMLNICADHAKLMHLQPYYLYRQKNMVGLFENIGYAMPGHESTYNVGMMAETQTIIGIGVGAVTKYVTGDKISRTFNVKDPALYMQKRTSMRL